MVVEDVTLEVCRGGAVCWWVVLRGGSVCSVVRCGPGGRAACARGRRPCLEKLLRAGFAAGSRADRCRSLRI